MRWISQLLRGQIVSRLQSKRAKWCNMSKRTVLENTSFRGRAASSISSYTTDIYSRPWRLQHKQRRQTNLRFSSVSCLYRNSKKESDLEAALVRLRDLEALLNSKDASLTTTLGEKRALEAEVKDLKAQLAKVKTILFDLKSYIVVVEGRNGTFHSSEQIVIQSENME